MSGFVFDSLPDFKVLNCVVSFLKQCVICATLGFMAVKISGEP